MEIKTFILNPFQVNCYLIWDKSNGNGFFIDPGVYDKFDLKSITDFVGGNNIKISFVLNTHGHIDHIIGNHKIKNLFNTPIYLHQNDLFLYENIVSQSQKFGLDVVNQPTPDNLFINNQTINFNGNLFEILNLPGHSPGSICVINYQEKIVFTGDLLFRESIGRTDLPGGDFEKLKKSIKILIRSCKKDYTIFPGHSEKSTIGYEIINNLFVRDILFDNFE
jgi:hydroxyacylglutathione hydrolase